MLSTSEMELAYYNQMLQKRVALKIAKRLEIDLRLETLGYQETSGKAQI